MYKPVGFYGPILPPVPNAPSFDCCMPLVQSEYPAERRAAAAVPLPESPSGQASKSISSISFVQIKSNFFLQYTGDTDAKMMDQNFEIRIL